MDTIKTITAKKGTILSAFFISLFGAIFLWEFWSNGINVLGINMFLYCFLFIAFFIFIKRDILTKKSLLWLLPLGLISLSMGIYVNTFTKSISLFLLPIIFFVFTTHEALKEIRPTLWSRHMFLELIFSVVNYISCVFESFKLFKFKKPSHVLPNLSSEKKNLALQIGLGVGIFLILSSIIFVPLLSSADSQFSDLFSGMTEALIQFKEYIADALDIFFRQDFFSRVFCTFIGTMLLLGYGVYWNNKLRETQTLKKESEFGKKYSVMISIILGGVLGLYLIFIVLQIKTLFIGSLPVDFEHTEDLVKTGFWQLFLLTIINILFYMGLYQKSSQTTQKILGAFTFASLLLIISAAHRTYLYVANYGLSYEKFYAFYTVIFCIGVFIWFLYLFAGKKEKPEIIRNLAFASLWMYALTTIVPLERIIFSTNLSLTQQVDSRVNINELKMLGFDALPVVENNFEKLIAESIKDNKQHLEQFPAYPPDEAVQNDVRENWLLWIDHNKLEVTNANASSDWENYGQNKRWYEKTVSELIY